MVDRWPEAELLKVLRPQEVVVAKRDGRVVQSLDRGLIALEMTLSGGVRPSELAEAIGVDRSSAYRLLHTLMVRGYVEQDPDTHEFVPSIAKFHSLTSRLSRIMNWPKIVNDFLTILRDRTGETANLGVLQGEYVVYIAQEQAMDTITVINPLGTRRPVHASALGKAIAAALPEADLERLIAQADLVSLTSRTITDPEILRLHLINHVRSNGYAVDDEETFEAVRCVAAPIFDHRATVLAAMGVSGPIGRIPTGRIPSLAATVVDVARQTSIALGYHSAPIDSR